LVTYLAQYLLCSRKSHRIGQFAKQEKNMIELIIGIIIGATFHEFWSNVYQYAKKKIAEWNNKQKSSSE
jgi:uncharacterized metal-binding protein